LVHNKCKKIYSSSGLKYNTIGNSQSGRLESVFAKIEPSNLGKGSATNQSSRDFVRVLGNSTDDGGHAIAKNLGGPGGRLSGNLFPQSVNINRGAYRVFEKNVVRSVQEGNEVFIRVLPKYNGTSTRPYEILYQVRTNGVTSITTFLNP
jgi:hypothetical protein